MDTYRIRDVSVLLPDGDPTGKTEISRPPAPGSSLDDVIVQDAEWSRTQVEASGITHSHLSGVTFTNSVLSKSRLTGDIFSGVDFSSSRWNDIKIDRCSFAGCEFLGANLTGVTAKDVIFEGCRFDYSYLQGFRAVGGLAFVNCSFRESTFEAARLPGSVFVSCSLAGTEFTGCDLRGNNLEEVRGLASLRRVIVDPDQLPQLTTAIVRDLEIELKDRPQ